ncbi:peptide-methionine (S)-S-oxide reductase MsrA [Mucilaginibacter jinjuensis]|uniref:Peptide methionine sulfoxide reductase MsrA n=1 Tax=Mucilaginibacter jinjuensis TaxID=1176721 RepID=A0ABY7T4E3_9SPHI|nr:peptide-methionine (S)-S-oxide reductase MsrA [Mucilaginibacter jinjuensis]WCT10117.1 peptide-methionine (S)-S-oxide reductase MsrA [Mucilaginibacter jinjuensis]
MINKFVFYIAGIMMLAGCANAQTSESGNGFAVVPQPKPGQEVATFGGGCFWAMSESMSELKGVDKVVAGFAGGSTKNPSYEDVCTKTTGHAEVAQVYFDPKVISYETLAEAFFYAHDPTELNYQGPDEGTDYRSIAFYRTPEQKATLEAVIKKVNDSRHYSKKIVTQVVPFKVFYPAEKYHQEYYKTHGDSPYIASVSEPKVMKMRAAMHAYLKPEYQK